MNREIKFRAYDEYNNEMYIVDNLSFEDGLMIKVDMFNDYFEPEEMILMQYTGLKDKNGVEIYEGDIIKFIDDYDEFEDRDIYEIGVIQNYDKIYKNESDESSFPNCDYYFSKHLEDYYSECEVIGNVWENGELLKESEE